MAEDIYCNNLYITVFRIDLLLNRLDSMFVVEFIEIPDSRSVLLAWVSLFQFGGTVEEQKQAKAALRAGKQGQRQLLAVVKEFIKPGSL